MHHKHHVRVRLVCVSDRSPDMENDWEDDDDSFSSEQEGSDDAVQPQVCDAPADH